MLLWVLIWINDTKNNRTSSDLMDKIITVRIDTRGKGWMGKKRFEVFSPHLLTWVQYDNILRKIDNKVIQVEGEVLEKPSRHHSVSVLMNHHRDCEGWYYSFFQADVVSILLYGCTTWMLTKRMKNKLDDVYTTMLQAVLKESWRQHPTKQQLNGH